MGASQSSQPPSRHNSRHGTETKHKQKAASISSTPMKPHQQPNQPPLPVIIDNPTPRVPTTPPVPQSVPAPAIALPIPVKKKPSSLPASKENSYIDQHKDADLLHRFDVNEVKDDMEEEMDETEVQSKFGIQWVKSDEFEDVIKSTRRNDLKHSGILTF